MFHSIEQEFIKACKPTLELGKSSAKKTEAIENFKKAYNAFSKSSAETRLDGINYVENKINWYTVKNKSVAMLTEYVKAFQAYANILVLTFEVPKNKLCENSLSTLKKNIEKPHWNPIDILPSVAENVLSSCTKA
eukprot:TRINITY_DN14263_c0_g1_i3.p1 TRINITY_DN14263_c0_g1~~TRINITY_DN14263_c0_g1_i3.p1  ORF type:complete len:135 (+),score=32.50 TRINITY_DN14263_c0_g1_i3:259-663(+)